EKLEAAFTSKSTIVLKGKSVDFINKSLGNPDGYKWTFQGGLPSISTAKNPQGIVYNVAGEYDVKLSVYKDGVFDRTMKENYIVVPETSDLMAAFDVSNKYSCPKGEVILINKSIGDYDKIEWTITPDTYEFVEGYDRHSRNAKVKLLEQDNYIVKLKVSNEYVTDEISKFAVEVNTEDSVFDLLNEDFDDDIDGVWHSNDTAFNWKQVRYDINNKTKTLLEYIIPENEKKKQHSLIFPAYYYHGTSFDINMGLDYAYGVQEGYVNDNTVELYYSMDCGNSWELVSDNILDLDNNKSYETTFVPSSLNSKVITSIPKTIGRYVFKIVIKGNTPSTFLLNKIWLDVEDGVEIIENNSIEVYPNLTKGIINIILNEKVDNDKIEICNILGRPLIIIKVDQLKVCKRVDISSFLKGMYFVRYMKENKAYSKKIIKE
ncbi:MAG: T9SS type A sorting domain-containing protein, partial [Hyphomicrobiales bacterium]